MADNFSVDQRVVEKSGRATAYMEDYLYQLGRSVGLATPASSSAKGDKGTIVVDGSFIHVCVETDTWLKVELSTSSQSAVASLSGATISSATVEDADKVLIQDVDDSGNLKTVTVLSIASLVVVDFSSPPPIGDVTPNTGDFTTLSGNAGACTVDGTDEIGFLEMPQVSKSTAYTTVLADSGKHIHHPAGDANTRIFTIDSNANVPYPLGTVISFTNLTAEVVTIAITDDTMYLAGDGSTGSRSLAQYGVATIIKVATTTWLISGTGLT